MTDVPPPAPPPPPPEPPPPPPSEPPPPPPSEPPPPPPSEPPPPPPSEPPPPPPSEPPPPPPSEPPPPPATPRGAPSGAAPLGRVRSPLTVILLSIVTLGIYTLYWYYRVFQDNKDYSGRGIGGVLGLVLGIFCAVVNFFVLPAEVAELYRADGREAPVSAVYGLWFLLPIVGAIIWVVQVQGAINRFWESKGQTAG